MRHPGKYIIQRRDYWLYIRHFGSSQTIHRLQNHVNGVDIITNLWKSHYTRIKLFE